MSPKKERTTIPAPAEIVSENRGAANNSTEPKSAANSQDDNKILQPEISVGLLSHLDYSDRARERNSVEIALAEGYAAAWDCYHAGSNPYRRVGPFPDQEEAVAWHEGYLNAISEMGGAE